MSTKKARSHSTRAKRVQFKISDDKFQELQEVANETGLATSTMVASIVGEWLYRNKKINNQVASDMNDRMNEFMKKIEETLDVLEKKS